VDDLRARLERQKLGSEAKKISRRDPDARQEPESGRISSIREQLHRLEMRGGWKAKGAVESSPGPRIEDLLGGKEVVTPEGTCYEIRATYRPDYLHGRYRLGDFNRVDLQGLDTTCGRYGKEDLGPEDVLFMDTETTGLSLGTGTYVFLLGFGYFRSNRYHIQQLFLRDFEEEPAFLWQALSIMAPFRALVSFNGKRFDMPLLETRLSMCGQRRDNGEGMAHWDLLYPARRMWKERLDDCRLGTIEEKRLQVAREEADIPGHQIPEVYYRYIHQADASDLDRIVYHNAMDILSLATLAIHLDGSLRQMDPVHDNLLTVGRFYDRMGSNQMGRRCYEVASGGGLSHQERHRAKFLLAMHKKREGDYDQALGLWQELIALDSHLFIECCEEIAKYYEHRIRDFSEAIKAVDMALIHSGIQDPRTEGALRKRRERLEKKGTSWRR